MIIGKKTRERMAGNAESLPIRYTVCLAAYHHPDDPDQEPIRATLAVVDLKTDTMVDLLEWDEAALEALGDEQGSSLAMECVERWGARAGSPDRVRVISILETPVPLQKCTRCPCGKYTVRTVYAHDLAAILHDERHHRAAIAREILATKISRMI